MRLRVRVLQGESVSKAAAPGEFRLLWGSAARV